MKFSFNFKNLDVAVKTNEIHKDVKHDIDVNFKMEELNITVDDVNLSDVAGLTKEIAGLLKAQAPVKEAVPAATRVRSVPNQETPAQAPGFYENLPI